MLVLYEHYGLHEMQHMLEREVRDLPRPDYMEGQPELNPPMRKILNDWLVNLSRQLQHRKESLFLAIQILDRYLSSAEVGKQHFQLVGSAAILLATKFEEVDPLQVEDVLYHTDNLYTGEEVHHMECSILRVLDFKLATPTAAHFLRHLAAACGKATGANEVDGTAVGAEDADATPREFHSSARAAEADDHWGMMDLDTYGSESSSGSSWPTPAEKVAWVLLDLSLLEIEMIRYRPSQVAAAALVLGRRLLGAAPAWPPALAQLTGLREEALERCQAALLGALRSASGSKLPGVRKRFAAAEALGATLEVVARCSRV